jgi:hypothetical protein
MTVFASYSATMIASADATSAGRAATVADAVALGTG